MMSRWNRPDQTKDWMHVQACSASWVYYETKSDSTLQIQHCLIKVLIAGELQGSLEHICTASYWLNGYQYLGYNHLKYTWKKTTFSLALSLSVWASIWLVDFYILDGINLSTPDLFITAMIPLKEQLTKCPLHCGGHNTHPQVLPSFVYVLNSGASVHH